MKRRLPPLNALRAFEAAARLGRMTAAADELAVTPGAISRQARQLEDHLGLSLFEGSKNKPQLSPAPHTRRSGGPDAAAVQNPAQRLDDVGPGPWMRRTHARRSRV